MNKKVCVLMSTYNGEKYLREQIDSILNQKGVDVSILIRDDGSSDATISILDEYSKNGKLRYYIGENVGSCKSFIELIWNVETECDYYALSDQDDYWLPDKLFRAVTVLEGITTDKKVYSSAYTIVDAKLNNIDTRRKRKIHPSFGNSLIENYVTGCTVVMSKELLLTIRKYNKPVEQYIHDWWIYKVGQIFGELYIDNESKILYRQHGNNTIGLSKNPIKRFRRILNNSRMMKEAVQAQNNEIKNIYPLDNEKMILLDTMEKKYGIFKLLFCDGIKRQNKLESIIYKLWILTW